MVIKLAQPGNLMRMKAQLASFILRAMVPLTIVPLTCKKHKEVLFNNSTTQKDLINLSLPTGHTRIWWQQKPKVQSDLSTGCCSSKKLKLSTAAILLLKFSNTTTVNTIN